MDLYFNELSTKQAPSKETALLWMDRLTVLFKAAIKEGFKILRTTENFVVSPLAPGYLINDWLNDGSIDFETRLLFKSKVSRSPFIESLLKGEENERQQLNEYYYNQHPALGLGAAFIYDSVAVSFDNCDEWDRHGIQLGVTSYSEDDEIHESEETVSHASRLSHLESLGTWLLERKKQDIPNGELLWLNRNSYFPHLIFCEAIENQVNIFSGSEPEFHAIVKRLYQLEEYCANWDSGGFDPELIPSKVTPESASRLQQFRKQLNIVCPDGGSREFSLHLRFTPGAGRIHFAPEHSSKKNYIGYIGSKIQ